jgi:hypothetical protein
MGGAEGRLRLSLIQHFNEGRDMQLQAAGFLAFVAMSTGCGSPEARADLPESSRVVDSIIPREEAVRRFRAGLTPVDSLVGGARTRDALVKAFIHALGEADTAALARLTVSRTEFAYLYYPTAAEGKPPYDLEPGLMWFMLSQRSSTGVGKALQLYGGSGMKLVDYDCGKGKMREGENTIVGPCSVRWTNRLGDTVRARLFSKILERGGRAKFLSYVGDVD